MLFKYLYGSARAFLLIALIWLAFTNASFANESNVEAMQPTHLSFHVRELGIVNVELNIEKKFESITDRRFFQGKARFRAHRFPVAATEYGGIFTISFPGKVTGSRKSRQRLYRIKLGSKSSLPRVSSVPRSIVSDKACSTSSHPQHAGDTIIQEVAPQQAQTVRVVTISAFTDPEWQFTYGSSSSAEIAEVLNTSEALYSSQLGIRFRLLSITNFSSSSPEMIPGKILAEFQKHPDAQGESNVKTLFTGKDMDGSTVGIAFLSSVCYGKGFEYNVVQSYGLLTPNIFSHELGHSLGAVHDTVNRGTVMYPTISFGDIRFSTESADKILAFLNAYGSCVATEPMTPPLDGATLSLTKRSKNISVKLLSRDGTGIGSQKVIYQIANKKGSQVTGQDGSITIQVRVRGRVRIAAYVESSPGIKITKTLRF